MSASQWGGPPAAFSTEGNALPAENGNDDDDELDYPLALMPAEARPAIADGERDATIGEAGPSSSDAAKQKPTPVPRRDKSLSALSHYPFPTHASASAIRCDARGHTYGTPHEIHTV